MRTISAAMEKVLASPSRVTHLRVQVKDAGGTWRDLSTLEGRNWIEGASWGDNVDQQVGYAKVDLVAQIAKLNMAPLDTVSKLNASGSLLGLNRELKIETAVLPTGVTPATGDWMLVFHGFIDTLEWNADPIVVQCRDLGGRLSDAQIKKELVYGEIKNLTSVAKWTPNTVMPYYHTPIQPTVPNGYAYQVYGLFSDFKTGATEPAWPTTHWALVSDGNVQWICVGPVPTKYGARAWEPSMAVEAGDLVVVPQWSSGAALKAYYAATSGTTAATTPNFNLWAESVSDGTVTWKQRNTGRLDYLEQMLRELLLDNAGNESLVVPTASAWVLLEWRQPRGKLLEALNAIAEQIGWCCRYRWDAASSSFKLTLYCPDRAKTTPDRTFDADDYTAINGLRISLADIRNEVQVVYSDSASLASNGIDYQRKTVTAKDTVSEAKYGNLWCEIAEGSSSNIDTATEAQALADAVLSDLAEPTAEQEVSLCHYFPFVETGDLYRFSANGVHSSSDLDLAVVAYEHTFNEEGATTRLTCRGKPSIGSRRWHRKLVPPGARPPPVSRPNAPINVSVSNSSGRSIVKFSPYRSTDRRTETELYVSTVSGFTPSSSTLNQRGMTDSFAVFKAAGTYYARLVTRDQWGNESAPSAQFTLAPT